MDHVVLAGSLLGEIDPNLRPDLLDGSRTVHRCHDHITGRGQAMHATGRVVLHDIPGAAAIAVALNRRVIAKPWPASRNAIPGRAQERLGGHWDAFMASTSRPQGP